MPISKEIVTKKLMGVVAERRFKSAVVSIAQGLSPEDLEFWASRGIPLTDVLAQMGRPLKPMSPTQVHPGVLHLMGLSEERLLEMIQEVAPEHAAVLWKYPEYSRGLLDAFRRLLITTS